MISAQEKLSELNIFIDTTTFPQTQLRYPLIGVAVYVATTWYLQPARNPLPSPKPNSGPKRKEITKLKLFMFVHNMLLCIFSAACFIRTFPLVFSTFYNYGMGGALCDNRMAKLFKGEFGFWAYLFYLSKFYEFIDTFIVIARGRRPIFLQTFHHCGAVLGMWFGLVSHCTGFWIFMVFNSFIHTIMYFYYALSSINIRIPGKIIITQLQMTQFVVGSSLGLIQIYMYGSCMTWEDKFVILYHVIYTWFLFALFQMFYKKTYKKKKTN